MNKNPTFTYRRHLRWICGSLLTLWILSFNAPAGDYAPWKPGYGIQPINCKTGFDKWFAHVARLGPLLGLKVVDDASWREWFWLYCYEPDEPTMTPEEAVRWTIKQDKRK